MGRITPGPAGGPPAAVAGLHLFLLGPFRVLVDAQAIDGAKWRRRKASALLKLLALTPAHRLHREEIAAQLWPEANPAAAANNFHQALYLARHTLDPAHTNPARWLRLEDDFLSLSPDEPVWIDVEAFEAAAEQARRRRSPLLYRQALDLYAGELLPEDRYDDWMAPRREHLQREYLSLKIGLAEAYQALNEPQAAIEILQQVIADDPHHEPANRALMALYAQRGERDRALAQYEALRQGLKVDLAAEPDPASQRLYQEIRAGQSRPLQPAVATPASNLPAPLTSFIGREHELIEVQRLLRSDRLLTLTGPGGCGKTRLALEVAQSMADSFPQGAWFVDLAPLSDPAFVPRAAADALGIPESGGKSVTEALTTTLRARQALIVLDNCEHLPEACAQLCHALLRACPRLHILATSREPLRITGEIVWLVPSLALPDLDHLPTLPELNDYAAVRLFVERAQAVAADFGLTPENATAVAQLCFHLDGIPLALELAAARVNVLAVEQILARLDDRFRLLTTGSRAALNRQQTLQAAIDWSHDLLSDDERVLFRRLAVFAGGWTLEALEKIVSDEELSLSAPVILDRLSRLVDKSLVVVEHRHGAARYRMLENIREYARQRLDEAGEAQPVAARHCAWCLSLVGQVNRNLWGPDHIRWVDHLESEHDNVRAALGWGAVRDAAGAVRLAVELEQFWVLRGHAREGLNWLQSLLAQELDPAELRAHGLLSQLLLRVHLGDYRGAAQDPPEVILGLYDQQGDPAGRTRARMILGGVTYVRTNRQQARAFLESALALAQQAGDAGGNACAQQFLGVQACGLGEYELASARLAQSLAVFRELAGEPDISPVFLIINQMPYTYGVRRRWRIVDEETFLLLQHVGAGAAVGYALVNQGSAARARGDRLSAATLYEAAQRHFLELGNQSGLSVALTLEGYLLVAEGEWARARAAMERSLALRTALGDRRGIGRSLNNLANTAIHTGEFTQARAWLDESLERFQVLGDGPGLAQTFNHLGNWALEQDEFAQAETYYGNSLRQFREFGNRGAGSILLNLAECARVVGDVAAARRRLEEARLAFETYADRVGIEATARDVENLPPD